MPFTLQNASVLTPWQQLVNAGKCFEVTNPSPGTAVAHANKTSFSATANGLFVIANNNPAGSGVNIYLQQLVMVQTATAPTGTLVEHYEVYNETGIVTGLTAVTPRTPVNLNPASSNTTNATVQAFLTGAITIPAAVGSRRLQAIHTVATGVTVIHDTFIITFGAEGGSVAKNGGAAARATDAATLVSSAPAVCIAPQTTSWINQWWVTAAANVPSYEYMLTYAELAE